MQKNTRRKRVELNVENAEEYIQFRLYKVKNLESFHDSVENGTQLKGTDLERINSSGAYTNKREVTARFSLKKGAYVIIPSCYDENIERKKGRKKEIIPAPSKIRINDLQIDRPLFEPLCYHN